MNKKGMYGKSLRRISVSVLMMLAILLTVVFPVRTHAANDVLKISASSAEGYAGNTITVDVRISDNTGFMGMKVLLHYNAEVVKPVGKAPGDLGSKLKLSWKWLMQRI